MNNPIRDRRRRATLRFYCRVGLLALLIAGIVWSAWMAPWARTHHTPTVELSR